MAIQKGVHNDCGTAILFTQDERRRLLLDTLHGKTVEETMWHMMSEWARFQPRATHPKSDFGQLYYPAEFSHVFEQYWQVLEQPLAHADAHKESDFTKEWVQEYTAALQGQSPPGQLLLDSDATEGCQIIAKQAACSRCCMIQEAHNFWAKVLSGEHRSSALTDGRAPASASGVGTDSVPGVGSMEIGVCHVGHPLLQLGRFFPSRRFLGYDSVLFGDGHQGMRAGCNGIAGECLTPVSRPPWGKSDGVDGTLRGPPAQNVYLFIYSTGPNSSSSEWTGVGRR
jgi:hypothetical protein